MLKFAILISVVALAVGASAPPSCTETADINAAIATDCPILAQIKASGIPLNKFQESAMTTLTLACPPNPSPTSATVVVSDLIAAYTALEPLLVK